MRGRAAACPAAPALLALILGLPVGLPAWAYDVAYVETTLDPPDATDRDSPSWPVSARLSAPTDAYDHDVLGPIPPFTVLEVEARTCGACRHGWESGWARLPDDIVFEDVAPRLWDVTGDGRPEVVVVESHLDKGARLAVWAYPEMSNSGGLTRIAATGFIGTRHRWLVPAGVADFDRDGGLEIAFVDRPHLVADLVLVRLEGDRLVEVANLPGVTNHRIGDDFISGGVRDCGQGPEVVAASPNWARVLLIGWEGGLVARDHGPMRPGAMEAALDCR